MTFEQYVKEHLGDFFLTGKKDYNMQVGIADKEQTFHNPLEDADYTVKPGDIILKGTVGEMWTTKLEKALKTYKMPDGTPLTEEYLNQHRGSFVDVKSEGAPNTNFALRVPEDISFIVPTSWAELTINKPGIDNGLGGMLVCRPDKFGRPDLSDVWVVNGKIFETTYDRTNDSLRDYPWKNSKADNRDNEYECLECKDKNTFRIKDSYGSIAELRFHLYSYLYNPDEKEDSVTITIYDKDRNACSREYNIRDLENAGKIYNIDEYVGDPVAEFKKVYPVLREAMKTRETLSENGEMHYRKDLHPDLAKRIHKMIQKLDYIRPNKIPVQHLMYKDGKTGIAIVADNNNIIAVSPDNRILDSISGKYARDIRAALNNGVESHWMKTPGSDHYDGEMWIERTSLTDVMKKRFRNLERGIIKDGKMDLLQALYSPEEAKEIRKELSAAAKEQRKDDHKALRADHKALRIQKRIARQTDRLTVPVVSRR